MDGNNHKIRMGWFNRFLSSLIILIIVISLLMLSALANENVSVGVTTDKIIIENEDIQATLSVSSGAILNIRNKIADINLFSQEFDPQPWRLLSWPISSPITSYSYFNYTCNLLPDKAQVNLEWRIDEDKITLLAKVEVKKDDPNLYFWIELLNEGEKSIKSIVYPICDGIGRLSSGKNNDFLATSLSGGVLFKNPMVTFNDTPYGVTDAVAIYPQGFWTGMQMMAYYRETQGGFYFAVYDPYGTKKSISFYKLASNFPLRYEVTHEAWDLSSGNDLKLDYPIVIGTIRSNYYEAAERYRRWATQQPWCALGTNSQRKDRPSWLLEAGLSFGGSPINDPWLGRIARFLREKIPETPILHFTYNWERESRGWAKNASWDTYFPIIDPVVLRNIEIIHQIGDYWFPFEFNTLWNMNDPSFDNIASGYAIRDYQGRYIKYEWGGLWAFMCLGTDFWREYRKKIDLELVKVYRADGLYHDVSVGAMPPFECVDPSHNHPKGAGRELLRTWNDFESYIRSEVRKIKPLTPVVNECANELNIPWLDGYRARSAAGLANDFRLEPIAVYKNYMKNGNCETIPLWEYVYHNYGPVMINGFARANTECGTMFYYTTGRTFIWGGIPEINNEFIPLPIPGTMDWDNLMLEFLAKLAKARSAWKGFLVYGEMLEPPSFDVPFQTVEWRINKFMGEESGTFEAPSILCSVWRNEENEVALIFLNISQEDIDVSVKLNKIKYHFSNDTKYRISYHNGVEEEELAMTDFKDLAFLKFIVPSRQPIMVKVSPSAQISRQKNKL